jgi:hypothetical protein
VPEADTLSAGLGRPHAWLRDRFVLLSLVLALLFCVYGMHWGVAESWHPDQMVYQNLFQADQPPLHPPHFLKPPFHTYLSLFLVRAPVYALSHLFDLPDHYRRIAELLCARMLTAILFLGQIILVFVVSLRFFGLTAARVAALLLATSAGFVAFGHFLTVDIPVSFWMLLAFWSAQNILLRGRAQDYVLAGLFTGIATATKYNGLAIGISIVVAHWLAADRSFPAGSWAAWRHRVLAPRLMIGIGTVVVGFVLANPFAVLDYAEFVRDFIYNAVTTQYYDGLELQSHYGYWLFFERFGDIFGIPGAILIGAGTVFAVLRLLLGWPGRLEASGVAMLAAVLVLYYAYFGSFGRLPARFVLPVAPYGLMLIGPLCAALRPRSLAVILVPILTYNVVCSLAVGWRLTLDPRMSARQWIDRHVVAGSSVEFTPNAPNPERFPGKGLDARLFPRMTGRIRMFQDVLADDALVMARLGRYEGTDADVSWYTAADLRTRAPDYIWIDSNDYEHFLSLPVRQYYPEIATYYQRLLDEEMDYEIAYDGVSIDTPPWLYPREIDFLENRITILQRRAQAPPAGP